MIGATIVLAVEWAIAHEVWHVRVQQLPVDARRRAVTWRSRRCRWRSTSPAWLGWVSHLAAAAVAVLLFVLSSTRGIPADPEGILVDPAVQRPVQLGLAGLVSIGALISWRWPPVGAVMLALAAGGLGTFAALQYEPVTAIALTIVVIVPAVLLWLSWQHRRRPHEIAGLAVATFVAAVRDLDRGEHGLRVGVRSDPRGQRGRAVARRPRRVGVAGRTRRGDDLGHGSPRRRRGRRPDDRHQRCTDVDVGQPSAQRSRIWSGSGSPTSNPAAVYAYTIEVDGERDTGRGAGTFRTPDGRAHLISCRRGIVRPGRLERGGVRRHVGGGPAALSRPG